MHATRCFPIVSAIVTAALAFACGGSSTPEPESAQTAQDTSDEDALLAEERSSESEMEHRAPHQTKKDRSDDEDKGDSEKVSGNAEPEFKENGSVADAIAAIPQDADRLNVDHQRLAEPLQNPDVYEPCKVGGQHFTMKVAVYNGRAVGIDIDTKNTKLADCVRTEVQKVEWPDKVKSLNTIEFGL